MKIFIKQSCLDMLCYLGISSTMCYMCDDNDNCRHQRSCMTKISKLNVILYTCLCKFRPMGLYKFVCYLCVMTTIIVRVDVVVHDKNFKIKCNSMHRSMQI